MSMTELGHLTDQLRSNDQDTRLRAINRLDQIPDPGVLDLLLEVVLTERVSHIRCQAESLLPRLGKTPEFKKAYLQKLIRTDSIPQRELIARTLQDSRDPETVNALVAISELHKHNFRLRESAVWALLNLDRGRAIDYCRRLKVQIVIADDELDIRDLICFSLMSANWVMLSANNGAVAYEYIRVAVPDLVLLDIRMPKLSGYEVCAKIKADPVLKHIPVVFLSARGQEAEIKQAAEAGGEEYIVKPCPPDDLVYRIKTILKRSRLGLYHEHG
jgi:CheY-like chemotaxis protein